MHVVVGIMNFIIVHCGPPFLEFSIIISMGSNPHTSKIEEKMLDFIKKITNCVSNFFQSLAEARAESIRDKVKRQYCYWD
jgi:hypothetical protein